MSSTIWMLLAAAGVMAASCAATGLVLPLLRRRAVLDHPNERSSHAVPTPRGGGIAVVVVLLAAWGASAMQTPQPGLWIVLAAAAGLAAVSWIDDLGSLPAAPRLAAQALAVAVAIPFLAARGPVFQGLLPGWLDVAAAAFAWLWFVNLFNFMDGIDGISGVEAFSIGAGVTLLALLVPGAGPPASLFLGASIAAAAAGFLWWNWHPAKVFLGDVGSVPLGFLLGWLLLGLAAAGDWAAALILPLYYLADATITLGCRALRREKVWQAHREHFYQRAVQRGRSHAAVSRAVLGVNACLAALAMVSPAAPWMALVAAALAVAGLLAWMAR